MVTETASSAEALLPPNSPEQLWEQITTDFREACLLRREGRAAEAEYILNEELPQAIAHWSRTAPKTTLAKKAELRGMFAQEQKRVEEAVAIHRILSERLSQELVPAISAKVAAEVNGSLSAQIASLLELLARFTPPGGRNPQRSAGGPARVRFDDVPGVIDAVLAEQRADYGPPLEPSAAPEWCGAPAPAGSPRGHPLSQQHARKPE